MCLAHWDTENTSHFCQLLLVELHSQETLQFCIYKIQSFPQLYNRPQLAVTFLTACYVAKLEEQSCTDAALSTSLQTLC